MERPVLFLVPCPVCRGISVDHGRGDPRLDPTSIPAAIWDLEQAMPVLDYCVHGHDWRFDKWSLTEPVVWRCRVCNANAEMVPRADWRIAVDGGFAHMPHTVRLRQLASSQLPIRPCDVCLGTGSIRTRDAAEAERVQALIARRAAKSAVGLMPRIGPRTRTRDSAVLSTCPRCGKRDRSVPVVRTVGASTAEIRLWRLGEAILDSCMREYARYCGRCDLEFGNPSEETLAGLF